MSTIAATSADRSDVATAIASATYGDTVTIPSGTGSGWTSGIAFTKDIIIQGAGIDFTTLNLGFTDDSSPEAFFEFTPDSTALGRISSLTGNGTFEVTGFTFVGSSRMSNKFGVMIDNNSTTVPAWRIKIHANKYTDIHRATGLYGDVWGVFYENTLVNTNGAYPTASNKTSWNNHALTLASGKGWYQEDNTFSGTTTGLISGGGHGMGHVVRYNTLTGSIGFYIDSHGNQKSYVVGTQITEVYGNYFAATTSQRGFDLRGGRAMYFYNLTDDEDYQVREEYADSLSGAALDNACAENGPQICGDDCVCMKVNHSYMWNNRDIDTNTIRHFPITQDYYDISVPTLNDPPELVENREFFTARSTGTFDGSGDSDKGGGVGWGTAATMNAITPTTDYVGFWVTDQSTSDLSDYTGANPTTPLSGTLYRWSGSEWVAWYTPYTYPHPLRTTGAATGAKLVMILS